MKKHILLTFFFLLFFPLCFSQNPALDSLLTVLNKTKDDVLKVKIYNNLFLEYEYVDEEKAKEALNKALELSKRINDIEGQATTYKHLGYFEEDNYNFPKALLNYFASLKLFEQIKNKTGMANLYNNIGLILKQQGNYPGALKNYFAAVKTEPIGTDKKNCALTFLNIANVYDIIGNYPEALKNQFAALKIFEANNDQTEIGQSLSSIGTTYFEQGDYQLALKNYFASLDIQKKTGNKYAVAMAYGNIANVFNTQGNFSEALKNYLSCLEIAEEIKNKKGIAAAYGNIGIFYANQKNYPDALKNYFAALKLENELGNVENIIISYTNIAKVFMMLKNNAEAKLYFSKAEVLAKQTGTKPSLAYIYSNRSDINSEEKNYKGAYLNHKLYILYRDSIENEETRRKTVQSQMTYEFEIKETATKAEQDKKDNITKTEKQKQKLITYSVSGGLFFVLIFALFIFKGYRQKQKANKELSEKNYVIEEQKKIVQKKNKDINDSINYAKRIQEAILIPETEIQKQFADSFVLFKPKDTVSGDFYWFAESKYNKVLVLADCTGHGVPGGFMSMLGFTMIQETILLEEVKTTADALKVLDKKITETLNRNNRSFLDGMDMALCAFSKSTNTLQFSCANRPLILIRNGELKEYAPDKLTIGGSIYDASPDFRNQEIHLKKDDLIYLFSDGYADQFGGPKGKKFKNIKLKETLIAIADKKMSEQKQILTDTFENWKGDLIQIDDVTIIGIRI